MVSGANMEDKAFATVNRARDKPVHFFYEYNEAIGCIITDMHSLLAPRLATIALQTCWAPDITGITGPGLPMSKDGSRRAKYGLRAKVAV